jgi:hypothetical protein
MTWEACTHKTAHDFCERQSDGSHIWTCAACGKREAWSASWSYFGNIECPKCWMTSMDSVSCSDACRKAQNGGKAPKWADDEARS